MKIEDILITEAFDGADRQIEEIEEAYEELEALATVFRTHDFGFLIGKPRKTPTKDDLVEIRKRIYGILNFNPIINNRELDGNRKLRTLGKKIAQGFEVTALSALALTGAALAGTAIAAGAGVTAVAAGGALSLGSSALLNNQKHTFRAATAAAKLVNISDAMNSIRRGSYKPNAFKRIVRWFMRKSPDQIQAEAEQKIMMNAKQARNKLEKLIADLPDTINYIDGGEVRSIPTEELFDV